MREWTHARVDMLHTVILRRKLRQETNPFLAFGYVENGRREGTGEDISRSLFMSIHISKFYHQGHFCIIIHKCSISNFQCLILLAANSTFKIRIEVDG